MSEPISSPVYEDPLSEVTRRDRRTLLGVAMIGIVVVKAGVVPTQITALGVKFSGAEMSVLMRALGVVVLYFVLSFALRSIVDFIARKHAIRAGGLASIDAEIKRLIEEVKTRRSDEELCELDERISSLRARRKVRERRQRPFGREMLSARGVSVSARSLFEYWVPVIVGVYACLLLFGAPPPQPMDPSGTPSSPAPQIEPVESGDGSGQAPESGRDG